MRFSTSDFLHGSVQPKPLIIHLGPFRNFFENSQRYFTTQGAPPVSLTPVLHLELENGKKSSSFIISLGQLLVVELAYR